MSIFYMSLFISQYLFICNDNKIILVDKVINIKTQNEILYNTFNIINNTKLNIHENSNNNYLNFCTDKNIQDIKEIYKDDYEIFKEYLLI